MDSELQWFLQSLPVAISYGMEAPPHDQHHWFLLQKTEKTEEIQTTIY